MRRKQIYLDEKSEASLKKLALLKKTSEASLIREAIHKFLAEVERKQYTKQNPLYRIVGLCERGRADAAENHDRYLYREDKD